MIRILILSGLLLLQLCSCKSQKPAVQNKAVEQKSEIEKDVTGIPKKADDTSLPTGKWKLAAITEKGGNVAIPNSSWNMSIEIVSPTRLAVQTPCNNGGCAIELTGITFRLSDCSLTEMYCAEAQRNEWQSRFIGYLQQMSSYNMSSSGSRAILELKSIDISLRFTSIGN